MITAVLFPCSLILCQSSRVATATDYRSRIIQGNSMQHPRLGVVTQRYRSCERTSFWWLSTARRRESSAFPRSLGRGILITASHALARKTTRSGRSFGPVLEQDRRMPTVQSALIRGGRSPSIARATGAKLQKEALQGCSSALGPYNAGTGTFSARKYMVNCAR